MKSKIKSIIIISIILFCMFTFFTKVNAAELYYGTDIKYEITNYYGGKYHDNDIAEITWINKNITSIEIPSNIKGYVVASIDNSACRDSAKRKVTG